MIQTPNLGVFELTATWPRGRRSCCHQLTWCLTGGQFKTGIDGRRGVTAAVWGSENCPDWGSWGWNLLINMQSNMHNMWGPALPLTVPKLSPNILFQGSAMLLYAVLLWWRLSGGDKEMDLWSRPITSDQLTAKQLIVLRLKLTVAGSQR